MNALSMFIQYSNDAHRIPNIGPRVIVREETYLEELLG